MLFAIGSKVRLVFTGDIGTVVSMMDKDTVNVRLEDGDEIPVDIENIRAFVDTTNKSIKPSQKQTFKAPESFHGKPKGTNSGVLLAFHPFYDKEGLVEYYNVYLANDTSSNIIFDCAISFNNYSEPSINSLLKSNETVKLLRLEFTELNDHPRFEFTLWQSTTMGLENETKVNISVKAKQFFKKVKYISLLQVDGPCYTILQKFKSKAKEKAEDLLSYTKRNRKEQKEEILYANIDAIGGIKDKAEFLEEIDLHIEKLTKDHAKLDRSEKLRFQLRVFDDYIDQAIRLGIDKVYIIHGLGKGSLRNKIQSRLFDNPYVKTFKNDHHPKYGFGATEVFIN